MAADRLATDLERSGADRLHLPEALREMAHYELELAAADVHLRHRDPRLGMRPPPG